MKILVLVLAIISMAADAVAQTPANPFVTQPAPGQPAPAVVVVPAAPAAAPIPEPAAPLENPAKAEDVAVFSFSPDMPIIAVITNVALQVSEVGPVTPAEELTRNEKLLGDLQKPIGERQFKNRTERQVLDDLLKEANLMIGTREGTITPLYLAPRGAAYIPMAEPPEGIDLAKASRDEDLQALLNGEYPLTTVIGALADQARINVQIDQRIWTGYDRPAGTNAPVHVAGVATNKVSMHVAGGVNAQQTLEAVLDANSLDMVLNKRTGFYMVKFKDPAVKEPVWPYTLQLHYSSGTNLVSLITNTFPGVKVQADQRTAQLVFLATTREYEAISNLVSSLDLRTRQVLIEARFLETSQNPKSLKGIDWTDTLQAQRFTMGNGLLSGGTTFTKTKTTPGSDVTTTLPSGRTVTSPSPSDTKTTSTDTKNTTLDSTVLSLTTSGGFTPNIGFLNAQGVSAVLSFLNTEADSRVLATPRAVTLDNQETRLEVTRSVPIFSSANSQNAASILTTTQPTYTNVGTILVVTPRITGSNVVMKVKPEISRVEPIPSRKVIAGQVNEADIFATSKMETHVMIPSGNTLVMGGLISDSTQKAYTKVPFLGDIPFLGWAFRKESKESSKANLIVFVTPTIIEDDDFQPHRTEFLNTKMPEHPDFKFDAANDGRPAWKRKNANEIDPENSTSGK